MSFCLSTYLRIRQYTDSYLEAGSLFFMKSWNMESLFQTHQVSYKIIINTCIVEKVDHRQVDRENWEKLNSTVENVKPPRSQFYTIPLGNTGLSKF